MVIVGVEGRYVKNAVSLTAALAAAGAPAPSGEGSPSGREKAHPTWFEPVFTVTRARYLELKPTLYPLPGTVFEATSARAG